MQDTEQLTTQVLILGGGPGGYSCAIRAAQLGLDVLLVEPERAGGTCLHAGCIPSKALIHVAERYRDSSGAGGLAELGIANASASLDWPTTLNWKDSVVEKLAGGVDGLLERAGVRRLSGRGEMQDGKHCLVLGSDPQNGVDGRALADVRAEFVVLATGATEVELPGIGSGPNVHYARDLLSLETLPETMAVIGGGYIGLELGQAFARLGVLVSVVEAQDSLLPAYPATLTQSVVKSLLADGVQMHTGARASRWESGALHILNSAGAAQQLAAQHVLIAIGRRPNLWGWGRENLALDLTEGNAADNGSTPPVGAGIAVNTRCETSMSGVYAIGDLTGEPMLAHRAMAQGQVVAECMAGRRREFAPVVVPAVCFTSPEIVCVGETAVSAKAAGLEVKVQRYPLAANARALTLGGGGADGFIEVVADANDHVLLGVQAVGDHVAELVHSFTLALEMGARLEDIADTIHAHPTLGETFAEASLAALGLPLHS